MKVEVKNKQLIAFIMKYNEKKKKKKKILIL